jgi:hypothetical protein
MELENEATWLRYRVLRLRAALRFALAPQVESILRELIADAEERLVALEAKARETEGFKPADNLRRFGRRVVLWRLSALIWPAGPPIRAHAPRFS